MGTAKQLNDVYFTIILYINRTLTTVQTEHEIIQKVNEDTSNATQLQREKNDSKKIWVDTQF